MTLNILGLEDETFEDVDEEIIETEETDTELFLWKIVDSFLVYDK